MNNATFIGNITKDIEIKYFDSGKCKASFSIAVNEGQDKTTFVDCEAWEKQAELIASHFKKGSKIGIVARYAKDTYEKDGQNRTKHYFVVNHITFCDKKVD